MGGNDVCRILTQYIHVYMFEALPLFLGLDAPLDDNVAIQRFLVFLLESF